MEEQINNPEQNLVQDFPTKEGKSIVKEVLIPVVAVLLILVSVLDWISYL